MPATVTTGNVQNHFVLLGLPVTAEVDEALLERNYRSLQAQLHPDRFVNADAALRVAALQQASLLNDAYTTLKSPLKRAEHLLLVEGVDASQHNQAHMDGAFLIAQMELREELEELLDAESLRGLGSLREKVEDELDQLWMEFSLRAHTRDFEAARRSFHKLQFMQKLLDEIGEAEERLDDKQFGA